METKTTQNYELYLRLYFEFMTELKLRLNVIDSVKELCNSRKLAIEPSDELCCLQLRKVCELIALGCIAAHQDIPETKSAQMRTTWSANDIMKMLDKLHSDFYPQPLEMVGPEEFRDITSGYLTKDKLKKLYGECGDRLHRGTLKNVLSDIDKHAEFNTLTEPERIEIIRKELQKRIARIDDWCKQIVKLLDCHKISFINKTTILFVMMKTDPNGKVHASIREKIDPPVSDGRQNSHD